MNRRSTRSTNARSKEAKESSTEKDRIKVTSRAPIKNQRKRHIDSVSDNGPESESPEPLKKSPKGTVPAHGLGSKSPEPLKKSSKGTVPARGLGSESPESLKKSSKDGTSVGSYLQKKPDGPRVAAKGNLELQTHPEPEKMDYSDDFNSVSPDGNQSDDDNDLTASLQNSSDEDMDSESEMETDGLQVPTEPSARQTSADIYQSMSYRESQNCTKPSCMRLSRPRVADYGTKQTALKGPFPSAGSRPIIFQRKSQLPFSGPAQADIRQPMNYRERQNYTDSKQSGQFIRPSVAGTKFFWRFVIPVMGLTAVLGACIFCLWISKVTDRPMLKEREKLFLGKWEKMKTMFPNQQDELWIRSGILLKKHIGTAVHTQPVILMFAAAQDAIETMQCLTRKIGEAYASVFNSSTLEINGSDKKSLSTDMVKLELDNQLSSAFQKGSKAVIIHHFQDLPPPSTLLFYKYCDHENAAFKDVSLLITVLLDEPTLNPDLPLKNLEETVQDFLKRKFCSDKPGEFNVMDADKLGGLWSRISHLVLPVRLEREIEGGDCPV
ncbi:uncharacterized protein LOC144497183 isoform X2 [Mustelus asterias]